MSITDELREWFKDRIFMANGWQEIHDIADRIDAEHESACAEAYGNGVQSVGLPDLTKYVKLPVDSGGLPIHIGDEMEGVDKYDSLKKVMGKVITVSFESDGIVDVAIRAWNSDGKSWHRAYLDPNASVYRHHHEPTVEDVLREFAEKITDSQIPNVHPTYEEAIAEYASKLRLAGDAE